MPKLSVEKYYKRAGGISRTHQPFRLMVKLARPLVLDIPQIDEEQAHRQHQEQQELKKSPWVDTQSRPSLK